jgi:hypothetical protein
VNFFQVDAAGLPLALTDTAWNNPALDPSIPVSDTSSSNLWKGQNFRAGIMRPVDPRIDWTLGRDSVPYKDWGLHNRGWIRDASYSGPYSPKKNIHEQAIADAENNVGWQATQTNDVPIHIFRYADLLLLAAEAEVEAGTLTRAAQLVNLVRARAGKTAQGCGATAGEVVTRFPACGTTAALQPMAIPLVAASATLDTLVTPWAYYKIGMYPVPFPSQAYARQAIHYERRLELAMEGQRFFDLRRWPGSDTTIARFVNKEKTRIPYLSLAAAYTLPQYQYYPIPSVQIELSKVGGQCMLQQNTGWGTCQ